MFPFKHRFRKTSMPYRPRFLLRNGSSAACLSEKLFFRSRSQSVTCELGEVTKLVGIIVRQVMLRRVIARRSEAWLGGHIAGVGLVARNACWTHGFSFAALQERTSMQLRHRQSGKLLYVPRLARAVGLLAPVAAIQASQPRIVCGILCRTAL